MAAVPNKPALHPLTSDDRGSLIIIIAYTFIFITVLAASIRFGLAWHNRLYLKKDDATFAGGVVSITSICVFNFAKLRRCWPWRARYASTLRVTMA